MSKYTKEDYQISLDWLAERAPFDKFNIGEHEHSCDTLQSLINEHTTMKQGIEDLIEKYEKAIAPWRDFGDSSGQVSDGVHRKVIKHLQSLLKENE